MSSLVSSRAARPPFLALLLALLTMLCALCLLAPVRAQTEQTLDAGAKIHVTLAGDTDNISSDYTVDSAGNITLLYAGAVHVKGQTPPQAAQTVRKALAKYYRDPQVVVTLLSAGGISIEVTGALATQGQKTVRPDAHLNDVLQQAGPGLDADLSAVQITHGRADQAHTQDTVDYLSFLNTQAAAGNPLLRDGDVIYVPRKNAVAIQVNVRGEVAKPGRLSVPSNTTLYDAITAAGGLTQIASRRAIALQHANTSEQTVYDFDTVSRQQEMPTANPILLDGDSVIVKAADVPNVFSITGAVRNPAEYPLTAASFTLADAIGKAGGLADRPKLKEVTITRTPPGGKAQVVKLDASDPNVQGNTLLQPGDNVFIPQGSPGVRYDPLTVIGIIVGIASVFRR